MVTPTSSNGDQKQTRIVQKQLELREASMLRRDSNVTNVPALGTNLTIVSSRAPQKKNAPVSTKQVAKEYAQDTT